MHSVAPSDALETATQDGTPSGASSVVSGCVGRESELRVVRDAVDDSIAGRGRLLLITGDPGMGKTLLAEELAAYARARGAQVVWGRCHDGEGAPPFWPWVQVIRSAVRDLDTTVLGTTLGVGAAEVAQIVPEIYGRLPGLAPLSNLDSAQARFRLFDSVTRFLENWTRRTPAVVVIDDLQGEDRSSLRLLEFVAREVHGMALLLVVTYRDGTVTAHRALAETVADVLRAPGTERLTLAGLRETEVALLAERALKRRPAIGLVGAIHKRTEGNPLFVSEVIRVLQAEGWDSMLDEHKAIRVPQSITAVIDRGVTRLSRRCQDLLAVACVIGREMRLDVLERIVNSPHAATAGGAAVDLAGALHEALAARVLVEVPGAAARYRFAHALICEALYERIEVTRRATLHRAVGEALAQTPDIEDHLAELAHHFCEAERDSDTRRAVVCAQRAAECAAALLAYEDAARLYQMALRALNRMATSSGTEAASLRCALLLALGGALARAGDTTGAKQTFWEAATTAKQIGAGEALAQAALGIAEVGVGLPCGAVDKPLVELLEAALALGEEPSALRVRLMGRLAMENYYGAPLERRAALVHQAVEMARRIGEPRTLAVALSAEHCALWGAANAEERVALAMEMSTCAQRAGDSELKAQARTWHIVDLLELGRGHALDREIALFNREAHELRQPRYLWLAAHFMAVRALSRGDFEVSERLAQDAFAHAESANDPGAQGLFMTHMFALRMAQGRLDELAPAIEAHLDHFRDAGEIEVRCGFAVLYSELGRTQTARQELDTLVPQLAEAPRGNNWLMALASLIRVCVAFPDAPHAAALYDLLLPYQARAIAVGHPATFYDGSVSSWLGILAGVLGRWEAATQHFEDALRREDDMGARPHSARAQYEYAAMLARRAGADDAHRAAALADQALAAARELGMKGLEQKALALREVLNAQPRRSVASRLDARTNDPQSFALDLPTADTCLFRKEGDYWVVSENGKSVHLKDSKGLHYVARLVRHPGQEFHVLDLAADGLDVGESGAGVGQQHERSRRAEAVTNILDARAKAEYRCRLAELREEADEADRNHDSGRVERLRAEIDFISEELAAAVGLHGRNRATASNAERARSAVTKRIKDAIAKIDNAAPKLGHYLMTTIKTGVFCVYLADPERRADPTPCSTQRSTPIVLPPQR